MTFQVIIDRGSWEVYKSISIQEYMPYDLMMDGHDAFQLLNFLTFTVNHNLESHTSSSSVKLSHEVKLSRKYVTPKVEMVVCAPRVSC